MAEGDIPVSGLHTVAELSEALRGSHACPHTLHLDQVVLRRAHDRLQGAEALHQILDNLVG